MDVQAYMSERLPLINAAIEERLPATSDLPASLIGAMRHLLFPGGKRLRPMFTIAACEAVGGSAAQAMPAAIAVELIHTYSLIHDDLPCMDDDDERRGQPTVHVAFDEATAVLAGDALLTEAFGCLSEGSDGSATARLFVIDRLSRAAGAYGLVGGQIDDLAFEAEAAEGSSDAQGTKAAWLASIHARKTAALFQAAVVSGAALGHQNPGSEDAVRTTLDAFAQDIGIAFQIADDVLDAPSEEAASILRLQGIDDAQAGAEALLDRALGRVDGWGERAEPLRELARFAVRRDR